MKVTKQMIGNMWREATFQKTSDWLLSWVYDVTDGKIYTGHDHVNIIPNAPNWEEKMMNNDFICGWYVRGYDGVSTRIATDTVPQEHADREHEYVDKAQKAAMKYWDEHELGAQYDAGDYCERCGEYVGDIDEHNEYYHPREYCYDCDKYYNPEYEDHSDPFCEECGEHVPYLDEHNRDYHFEPEPGMPHEGEKIEYNGKDWLVDYVDYQGMHVQPYPVGGQAPVSIDPSKKWILTWEDYKNYLKQQKLGPQTPVHPDQLDLSNYNPYLWQEHFLKPQEQDPYENMTVKHDINPTGPYTANWLEKPKPVIMHIQDLQDRQVFAKLSKDYLHKLADEGPNNWLDYSDVLDSQQKGNDIYQGLNSEPIDKEQDFTPEAEGTSYEDNIPTNQPDDPKMIDIARDWDSEEYRWSYDGHQLHMWRVFNRSAYGPSHYDMFGTNGYANHSQGRVYVSDKGEVGVLYWQITHPECERVLNEWCLKTFGKLPDYVYRAYGPYQGRPVSRWDFPIVEVGGLPINKNERWWEMPGGYPGMKPLKKDYPATKNKSLKEVIQDRYNPGPVDDDGNPVTPGKNKRRKRTRNRKYRNRSFRRR